MNAEERLLVVLSDLAHTAAERWHQVGVPPLAAHPWGTRERLEADRLRRARVEEAQRAYFEVRAALVKVASEIGSDQARDLVRFFGPNGRRWRPSDDPKQIELWRQRSDAEDAGIDSPAEPDRW